MESDQITYRQLDELLTRLGFIREKMEPKWLRYGHAASGTEIILVEKKPAELVRPSDAWSAREHLLQKGMLSEEEFNSILNNATMQKKSAATPAASE